MVGLLIWWSCNSGNSSNHFRPIQGKLIIQSAPLMLERPVSLKLNRHLGRFAKPGEDSPMLWISGKDTIPLTQSNTHKIGINLIQIDTTASGLENFISRTPAESPPFTIVISPLSWSHTIQLHQSQPLESGQIWICTKAKFQREPLQINDDILLSPGNDREVLFKVGLSISNDTTSFTDVSPVWFKQEQLSYLLIRASKGKYPAQPVVNWASTPTLLSFYNAVEKQIDSLSTVITDTPNHMTLEIIAF